MHQTDYTQKLYQRSLAHIANNIAHFVADKSPSAAQPPLTDARVLAAVAGLFCTYVLYATQLPERETTTVLADASGRTRRVVTGPWTRPYVDPATLAALGQLAELASANRNCMDDVCSVLAHLLVGVDGGAPICVIGAFPFVNCSTPAPALAVDKSAAAAAAAAAAAGESAANKRLLSVLSAETVRPTKGAGALLGAKFVVSQDERRKLALSKAWEVAHEVAHTLCPVTAQAAKEIESTQAVSNDEMAEVLGLSSAPTATLALADYDNALTGLGADEPPHQTAQSLNVLQDVLFNFSKTCSNALGQAAVKQRLTTAVGADTLAPTPPAGTTNLTREAMVAALAIPDHDGEPGLGISVAVPWRNLRRHERKRLQVPAKKEIGVAKTTTKVTRRKLPGIAYKFSRKEAAKEKEARYRQRYRDAAVGPAQVLAVAVGSTQKPLGVGILPDIGPAGNRAPDPVMMPPPPPPRVRTTVSKPGHRKVGRPRNDPENSTTERPKKQPSLTTAPDSEKRKRGRPKKDPGEKSANVAVRENNLLPLLHFPWLRQWLLHLPLLLLLLLLLLHHLLLEFPLLLLLLLLLNFLRRLQSWRMARLHRRLRKNASRASRATCSNHHRRRRRRGPTRMISQSHHLLMRWHCVRLGDRRNDSGCWVAPERRTDALTPPQPCARAPRG
ncbi:hypothetical protein NFJ02_36g91920 [Pycnococcus provasolii]